MSRNRSIRLRKSSVILILILPLLLVPNQAFNGGVFKPVQATTQSSIGIWNTAFESATVLNTTASAKSPVVFSVNVTGGLSINGFDINVTWDPTVLTFASSTIRGGIFDRLDFDQLINSHKTGWVEQGGVLLSGARITGTGVIFTFTLNVTGPAPASTTIHIAKGELTQPAALFPTLMDGFFSNIPGNSDLMLTSMKVTEETATVGDVVDVYVGVRDLGPTPMAGVVVTLSYNNTRPINSTRVGTVAANSIMTAKIVWNTTSYPLGLYNLNATVTTSSPDSFSGDNSLLLERVTLVTHDLAVTSIIAPPSALVNTIVRLGVGLQNLGTVQDTANVTIMANSLLAANGSFQLGPGSSGIFYLGWNTTNVPPGTYVLKATVKPVPGEKNLANDVLTDGTILIESSFGHDLQLSGRLPVNAVVGDNVTLTFVVKNNGNSTENYLLQFFVGNQAILKDQNPIAAHTNHTVTLSWNTQSYAYGGYTILANVTLIGARDENMTNDQVGPSAFGLFASPVAKFVFSPTTIQPGTSVTFDASSSTDSDSTIISYIWNFGDGSRGSGRTVSHSYNASGTYQVKLIVRDNNGVSSQSTVSVTVASPTSPLFTILAIASGVAVAAGLASWFLIFRRRKQRLTLQTQKTP